MKFRRASDVSDRWGTTIALYGSPGVGKTTTACELADSAEAPVLYCDVEGGVRAVTHRTDILLPEYDIRTWAHVKRVLSDVQRTTINEVRTVVWDNLSEIESINFRSLLPDPEAQISPQIYGISQRQMLSFMLEWRELSRKTGINVVFIAWDTFRGGDDNRKVDNVALPTRRDLSLTSGLARKLPGLIDAVGLIRAVGTSDRMRVLTFVNTEGTACKLRRSLSEKARTMPTQIRYKQGDVVLADVLAVMRGDTEWPTAKYKKDE